MKCIFISVNGTGGECSKQECTLLQHVTIFFLNIFWQSGTMACIMLVSNINSQLPAERIHLYNKHGIHYFDDLFATKVSFVKYLKKK